MIKKPPPLNPRESMYGLISKIGLAAMSYLALTSSNQDDPIKLGLLIIIAMIILIAWWGRSH